MGGGSGDAAAALRLAAHAAGRPGDPLIDELAPLLGADVPAQIEPARALVTGAGEHVEPLPPPPPFGLLVLPSAAQLRTPAVYAAADALGTPRSAPALARLLDPVRAAAAHDGPLPPELAVNDLEPAARRLCPEIERGLAEALDAGAHHAMVSGSGPTVFGVFPGPGGPAAAAAAAVAMAGRRPVPIATAPAGPALAAVHAGRRAA